MDWENLIFQLPLVAAVIWFVLEVEKRNATNEVVRDKEWRTFLTEQREAYTQSLAEISESVKDLRVAFDNHDRAMDNAVTEMKAVTAARRRKS
jgi:hypothetical protein